MSVERERVASLLERAETIEPPHGTDTDGRQAPTLRAVAMGDLATAELPPVRFVIEPLLPRRHVTLLAGHGDAGKSLLALAVAAHLACGARFGDLTCVMGRVLYVSLEDDGALVRLRLSRIAATYSLDIGAIARNVTVLEACGDDSSLAFEHMADGTRRLLFTPALEQIRKQASGHALVIIDNASDAYDANENERRLVRRFVRALQRIGQEHDAAVLLLAHVDKMAARHGANGETYSGSTAWHNSVRSRLALVDGESGLELKHEKCNLARPLEHPIALERTEHGVPVPLSRAAHAQRTDADGTAIMAAIRAAIADGILIPTARTGSRTAAHVLGARPELPEDLAGDSRRLWDAITKLERDGRIRRESYRTEDRKQRERFSC